MHERNKKKSGKGRFFLSCDNGDHSLQFNATRRENKGLKYSRGKNEGAYRRNRERGEEEPFLSDPGS